MKEPTGWLFCQGHYDYHESRTRLPGMEYYLCRQDTEEPHWHRVFADGVIDWDVMVSEEEMRKIEQSGSY